MTGVGCSIRTATAAIIRVKGTANSGVRIATATAIIRARATGTARVRTATAIRASVVLHSVWNLSVD